MENNHTLQKISNLFEGSGISVNGTNPYDIKIDEKFMVPFYYRIVRNGSLGLGESYMDAWWNCEKPDEFFTRIFNAGLDKRPNTWRILLPFFKAILLNHQTRKRSKKVAESHYNLPFALFRSFLDPYNQYSCGYFKNTNDLNEAQQNKLDLICRKLNLSPNDRVLDIGCGWGGLSKYMAEHYGCKVTGISIAEEQVDYARELNKNLPVEIIKMDYRDLGNNKFTKIVSVGMVEHVGYKNYREFMKIVHRCLDHSGLFLLHTIGGLESGVHTDAWINKYIFPNSMLPSIKQISEASERLFITEDLHNFGLDYDKTLMAWYSNFKKNWGGLDPEIYDERFYRMWEYYLLCCAASFRSRKNQLYQFVFSKNRKLEYITVR